MHSSLRRPLVKTIHEVSWATGLSERLARRQLGGRVLVLHEVGTASYPVAQFRRHLSFLRERYRVVTLDQLLSAAASESADVDRMVALSFDDGLRHSVLTAVPLLEEFGMPALFLLCPALIEEGAWLWTHDCRERLRSLAPSGRAGLASDFGGPSPAPDHVVEWMKGLPEARRMAFHDAIRAQTRSFQASEEQHRDFDLLRWEDLSGLPSGIVTIGSHGTRHRALTMVGDADLEDEVETSREWLERKLGSAVEFFSYPNGRLDDRVVARVRMVYRAALAAKPGFVQASVDPYRIPRIGVPRKLSTFAWRLHSPGWAGGRE